MLPILPSYSAPSTANIQPSFVNASEDVRNLVESESGVNDRLQQLSNNIFRTLTTANNGITLNANQDVQVLCNANTDIFEFTLPPSIGQYKPIYFEKIDNTNRHITINANGADKIGSLFTNQLTVSEDNIKLYVGGMSFVLYPVSGGWRITQLFMPSIELTARMSANQSLTNSTSNTTFAYNTVVVDTLGAFNTTTKRYTPTVPGKYQIMAKTLWASGTSSLLLINIFKNNTTIRDQFNYTTANSETTTTNRLSEKFNGVSDFFEITGRTQGANRLISADAPNDRLTYLQASWIEF